MHDQPRVITSCRRLGITSRSSDPEPLHVNDKNQMIPHLPHYSMCNPTHLTNASPSVGETRPIPHVLLETWQPPLTFTHSSRRYHAELSASRTNIRQRANASCPKYTPNAQPLLQSRESKFELFSRHTPHTFPMFPIFRGYRRFNRNRRPIDRAPVPRFFSPTGVYCTYR